MSVSSLINYNMIFVIQSHINKIMSNKVDKSFKFFLILQEAHGCQIIQNNFWYPMTIADLLWVFQQLFAHLSQAFLWNFVSLMFFRIPCLSVQVFQLRFGHLSLDFQSNLANQMLQIASLLVLLVLFNLVFGKQYLQTPAEYLIYTQIYNEPCRLAFNKVTWYPSLLRNLRLFCLFLSNTLTLYKACLRCKDCALHLSLRTRRLLTASGR